MTGSEAVGDPIFIVIAAGALIGLFIWLALRMR